MVDEIPELPSRWTIRQVGEDNEALAAVTRSVDSLVQRLDAREKAEQEAKADGIKELRALVFRWALAFLVFAITWGLTVERRLNQISDTRFTAAEGQAFERTDALIDQRIRVLERFHDLLGR